MLVTLIIIISAAAYAAPWDGYFWAKGLQGGKCSTLGLQKYTSKTYCIYEISQSGKTAAGYTGPNCGARAYCDESSWGTAVYVKQDSSCYNASYCTCKPGETTYQNCHVGSAWGIQTKNCNSYGTAWGNWGTCKPLAGTCTSGTLLWYRAETSFSCSSISGNPCIQTVLTQAKNLGYGGASYGGRVYCDSITSPLKGAAFCVKQDSTCDQPTCKRLGVAPEATIYAYKVMDAKGIGGTGNVIAAIERAADPNQDGKFDDHLDVLNLSLGGGGGPDSAVSVAVDNAVKAGVIVVVSAGNNGPDAINGSPAQARSAITVGSVDTRTKTISSYSAKGPVIWNGANLEKPDVVAPGCTIWAAKMGAHNTSSDCSVDYIGKCGKSMASPHVAGVAALMKQKNKSLTPEQAKNIIKSTATNLGFSTDLQGSGEIDALKAVNAVSN